MSAPRKTFPLRLSDRELAKCKDAATRFSSFRYSWSGAGAATPTEFIRAAALDVAKLVAADGEGVLPSVRIAHLQARIARLQARIAELERAQCEAPASRNAPELDRNAPELDDEPAAAPWADPDDVHPVEG